MWDVSLKRNIISAAKAQQHSSNESPFMF
jgi:hypothetical protein